MIIGSLLNIFYLFVAFFIGMLPVSTGIPTAWTSAVATIWSYLNAWNYIFPIDTFVLLLAAAMTVHLAFYGVRLSFWVIHLIRGN